MSRADKPFNMETMNRIEMDKYMLKNCGILCIGNRYFQTKKDDLEV